MHSITITHLKLPLLCISPTAMRVSEVAHRDEDELVKLSRRLLCDEGERALRVHGRWPLYPPCYAFGRLRPSRGRWPG